MEIVRAFQRKDGEEIPESVIDSVMEVEKEKRRARFASFHSRVPLLLKSLPRLHRLTASRFGTDFKEPRKEAVFGQQEDVVQVKRYYNKADQEYRRFKGDFEARPRLSFLAHFLQSKNEVEPALAQPEEDEMEVDEKASLESKGKIRIDTLHLRGTDDMSTTDIFHWAGEGLAPLYVEWIDDTSCNLAYGSRDAAQKALMALSEELDGIAGTPFDGLRRGRAWKNTTLWMRFAYAVDKKENKKRKPSRYYQVHGFPGEESERPRKRARIDENPNTGRQVAIKPMKHRLAMDDEKGEGIMILIPNDKYEGDSTSTRAAEPEPSPRPEADDAKRPPPAPPSTPAGAAPGAPTFVPARPAPREAIPEADEAEGEQDVMDDYIEEDA